MGIKRRLKGGDYNNSTWTTYKKDMNNWGLEDGLGYDKWLHDQYYMMEGNEEWYKETYPYEYKYYKLVTSKNNNNSTVANNTHSVTSYNSNASNNLSVYEEFDLNNIESSDFNEKLIENIEYIKDQYPDKYESWKTSVKKSFDNTWQSPGAKDKWKKDNPNTMRWFQVYDTTLKFRGGSRKKSVSKRKTLKKRKY